MSLYRRPSKQSFEEDYLPEYLIDDNDEVGVQLIARPQFEALEQKYSRLKRQRRNLHTALRNSNAANYWWRSFAQGLLVVLVIIYVGLWKSHIPNIPTEPAGPTTSAQPLAGHLRRSILPVRPVKYGEKISPQLRIWNDAVGFKGNERLLIKPANLELWNVLPPPFQEGNIAIAHFGWGLDNPWMVLNYNYNYHKNLIEKTDVETLATADEDLESYVSNFLIAPWKPDGFLCKDGFKRLFTPETCEMAVDSFEQAYNMIKQEETQMIKERKDQSARPEEGHSRREEEG